MMEDDRTPEQAAEFIARHYSVEPTHIAVTYLSKQVMMLFRARDGIQVGMRKGETIVWGEDPSNAKTRIFIDEQHADKFLRSVVAQADWEKNPTPAENERRCYSQGYPTKPPSWARIIERDGESLIVDAVPGASRVLKIH